MKILLCNQDWFAAEFQAAGHEVLTCGMRSHLQVGLSQPYEHIDSIISRLPHGFRPDRIVVYDESSPIMIGGLEETAIPTLFYSVDTHHHATVHKYLAHVFDATLVAQKDYLPQFEAVGAEAGWMPLWASRHIEPSSEKKWGAVFVGTLDKKLNPGRVEFFEKLKQLVPVETQTGEFWKIFPHSEIVINQTVKSDLNFRVFEAMMSGALLLTESSSNGLGEIFKDGAELVTYQKDNVEEAASRIKELLADQTRCRAIGNAGRESILAKHLGVHRAQQILDILQNLQKRRSKIKYFSLLPNLNWASKILCKVDKSFSIKANTAALRIIDMALGRGETLPEELSWYAALCCIDFDLLTGTKVGEQFLKRLTETFNQYPILAVAQIWAVLNRGERDLALGMVRKVSGEEPNHALERIDELIRQVL